MATTSSLGIGTGVDLQSMLSAIMTAERAPLTVLDSKISAANTKISMYGTLQSKIDTLKSAAETLRFPSRLSAITASSSDATIVSASAAYTAAVGTYAVDVKQLATAQKDFSLAYSSTTTFGQGTLTFKVGGVDKPVELNSQTAYTLEEVSAQINNAKIGVTATVVTGLNDVQRMILTSDKTGADNGFELTATGGMLPLQDFDLIDPALKRSVAVDGLANIDGIDVQSSNNSFTGVRGLTLTAVKEGLANVTVQNDSSKITTAVQAFVDAYNAVATLIKSNNSYNTATKTGQAFNADSAARSVLETLSNSRSTIPSELSGATLKTLRDLGVSVQQTGMLSLDTTKLSNAISTSATSVVQTLNAYGKSFSTAVADMQSSGGAVFNRLASLKSSITANRDTQEKLTTRIALVEQRYRAQFTALDKLMSTMKVISSSLEQQLTALAK